MRYRISRPQDSHILGFLPKLITLRPKCDYLWCGISRCRDSHNLAFVVCFWFLGIEGSSALPTYQQIGAGIFDHPQNVGYVAKFDPIGLISCALGTEFQGEADSGIRLDP